MGTPTLSLGGDPAKASSIHEGTPLLDPDLENRILETSISRSTSKQIFPGTSGVTDDEIRLASCTGGPESGSKSGSGILGIISVLLLGKLHDVLNNHVELKWFTTL